MLYYLFTYLDKTFDFPGAGMFQYISFRAALVLLTSLIISTLFGKRIIRYLQRLQIGEEIRDLGLHGQMEKKGTPTMGGLIIIFSILFPVLLFSKLHNSYILLMIGTTVLLGLLGFLDDYIKVFKKNKKGLSGKFKLAGQVILGLIVGLTFTYSDDVVVRDRVALGEGISREKIIQITENPEIKEVEISFEHDAIDPVTIPLEKDLKREDIIKKYNIPAQGSELKIYLNLDHKSTKTTIPFFKNNELDYAQLISFLGKGAHKYTWIIFVIIVIIITAAVSNGANITDGLDGLAAGTSSIMGITLIIFAYVSGNAIFSDYLNIMYIPNLGELVIFMSAFVGATVGFLWFNAYPAQVFMGDTGSLTIGGIIAVFSIIIRKELLIPLLCGIFLLENLSVMLQVAWFKYTKKKFGEGRRIFRMAPLHHHYQVKGYPESKIVTRFWIIGIFLAVLTIITLKIR